eukprot:TRINITY_DN1302_c1_g1_i1.p1 TRINITY_DN1302_c1_g1~~TRINITY_DN1302_c1_g1_i1.p1  ORF type:complete len:962 (+),score=113.51 TRINITY_DN1302_c1_g1_i1:126-3011(+)
MSNNRATPASDPFLDDPDLLLQLSTPQKPPTVRAHAGENPPRSSESKPLLETDLTAILDPPGTTATGSQLGNDKNEVVNKDKSDQSAQTLSPNKALLEAVHGLFKDMIGKIKQLDERVSDIQSSFKSFVEAQSKEVNVIAEKIPEPKVEHETITQEKPEVSIQEEPPIIEPVKSEEFGTGGFMTGRMRKVDIRTENIKRASAIFAEVDKIEETKKEPEKPKEKEVSHNPPSNKGLPPGVRKVVDDDLSKDAELDTVLAQKPMRHFGGKRPFKPPTALPKKQDTAGKAPAKPVEKKAVGPKPSQPPVAEEAKLTNSQEEMLLEAFDFDTKPPAKEEKKVESAKLEIKEEVKKIEPIAPEISITSSNNPTPEPPAEKPESITKKRTAAEALGNQLEPGKLPSKTSEEPVQIVVDQSAFQRLQTIFAKCQTGSVIPLTLCNVLRNGPAPQVSLKSPGHTFGCICSAIQNTECTLCCNEKKIGPKQLHSFLLANVKGNIPLEWVQNHYRLIVWKLGSYSVNYEKNLLTLENVMYQLWKRYNNEYVLNKYPFFYNVVVTSKISMKAHCVLILMQIIEVSDKSGIILELSDGHYSVFTNKFSPPAENAPVTTNEGLIYNLVKSGKLKVGQKIHLIGAELLSSTGLLLLLLFNQCKIQIPYNGISKAAPKAKLGLQKKAYLYKSISSLSPYGGPVNMIDVMVCEKKVEEDVIKLKGVDALYQVTGTGKEVNVEVLVKKETWGQICDGIEKGKRVKIFNILPIEKQGVDYMVMTGCEGTRIKIISDSKSTEKLLKKGDSLKFCGILISSSTTIHKRIHLFCVDSTVVMLDFHKDFPSIVPGENKVLFVENIQVAEVAKNKPRKGMQLIYTTTTENTIISSIDKNGNFRKEAELLSKIPKVEIESLTTALSSDKQNEEQHTALITKHARKTADVKRSVATDKKQTLTVVKREGKRDSKVIFGKHGLCHTK